MENRKTVILCYSRTGNTRKVADMIRHRIKEKDFETDLIEIETDGKMGLRRIGKIAKEGDVSLLNSDYDLSKYDLVVIGTPIWGGKPAIPCISYLKRAEKMDQKAIALFITGMRATAKNRKTVEDMRRGLAELDYGDSIATLILRFRRGKLAEGEEYIDGFVDLLTSYIANRET